MLVRDRSSQLLSHGFESHPGLPPTITRTRFSAQIRFVQNDLLFSFAYTASMSRYDRPSHQVYMYFFLRGGRQVQVLEADLKTPLPRKLTFSDPEKIRDLARRGEACGCVAPSFPSWKPAAPSVASGGAILFGEEIDTPGLPSWANQ